MATRSRLTRLAVVALTVALLAGACGSDDDDSAEGDSTTTTGATTDSTSSTASGDAEVVLASADLRMTLNGLLQEHVFLAGAAVNEALQGNTAGFDAAVAALDENSVALSEAIGLAYGEEAGSEFLDLWRSHIELVVAYANAVAIGDQAAADEQVEFLTGYATDFANFLAGPTGIDAAVLEDLVLEHILTLKDVVDTMAAGDPAAAFVALRDAMGHMQMVADPLAIAIAAQQPEAFPGEIEGTEATVQTGLDLLLQEHVLLAGAAVNEALRGNTAGFDAAVAALDANSVDLSEAVGDAVGEETGTEFLDLWRSHIDLFVNYATAVAADDQAAADEQVEFLTGYATDFANFLAGPTGIEAAALEELVLEHILTLKEAVDVIDSGEGNPFIALREAGAHMGMIAQPLAVAIANA
jgi:hypothetical protein